MHRTHLLTAGLLALGLTAAYAGDYKAGSLVVADP